jgi:hypothetical protein
MTLYEDIAKCATSLLDDDFDSKMTVKAKSKAACGVGVTSKSVINPSSLAVAGALEGKYSFKKSGFAIDKLAIDSKGKLTCETSLSPNMVNGLTVGLNRTQDTESTVTDLNLEYVHSLVHADTKFQKTQGNETVTINSSFLSKMNEISFGGKVDCTTDFKADNVLQSWGLGASYCDGKLGVFATTEKLTNHSVWATYKCSDVFKCGTQLTCVPESKSWSTALGGAYKCNKDNTFKAKITKTNDALSVNLGHKATIKKGTDVSGAIGYKVGDSTPTYGFTVTLA